MKNLGVVAKMRKRRTHEEYVEDVKNIVFRELSQLINVNTEINN